MTPAASRSDDWTTINQAKQAILQPYLIAPVGGGSRHRPRRPAPATVPRRRPADHRRRPTGGCTATYKQDNAWQGGFQGSLTVKNTGSAAVNPWR